MYITINYVFMSIIYKKNKMVFLAWRNILSYAVKELIIRNKFWRLLYKLIQIGFNNVELENSITIDCRKTVQA